MFLSELGREYSHATWTDHTVEPFLLLLPFVNNVYVTLRITNKAQRQRTCHLVTSPNLQVFRWKQPGCGQGEGILSCFVKGSSEHGCALLEFLQEVYLYLCLSHKRTETRELSHTPRRQMGSPMRLAHLQRGSTVRDSAIKT